MFQKKDKTKDGVPKKLKEFYDPKAPQIKKFKSLTAYCGTFFLLSSINIHIFHSLFFAVRISRCEESANSAEEVKAFFQKEAYNVWAVFLDTFQHYEQTQKSSKGDSKGYFSIRPHLQKSKNFFTS